MDLVALSYNLASLEVKELQDLPKKEFYFTQTDYVSNSDLSKLDAMSRGIKYHEPPQSVYEFGSAFDKLVTEPDKFSELDYNLEPHHFEQMRKMQFLINNEYDYLLSIASKQKEYYERVCVDNSCIKARCKVDIEVNISHNKKIIIDLKTTTCQTLREFYKKIFTYSYDRAAAWYLDVTGASEFFLVVCNYTNKEDLANNFTHQVWQIKFTSEMLNIGRIEYRRILKFAIENQLIKPL